MWCLPRELLVFRQATKERVVSCGLVAMFAVMSCSDALTLKQVEEIYAEKLAQMGTYEVRFRQATGKTREDLDARAKQYSIRIVAGKEGIRIEKSRVENEGSEIPVVITSDDGDRERSLFFSSSGTPDGGGIRPASTGQGLLDQLFFTPIGLAGLIDSAGLVGGRGASNGGLQEGDIHAIARDPDTRLLEETVMLDGEEAYVLEWPASADTPLFRFWLSSDRNLALLQAETYYLTEGGEQRLFVRSRNWDFEEVAPELFLPGRSEFRFIGEGLANPSTQVISFSAARYGLGIQADDGLFRLSFPAGIQVTDDTSGVAAIKAFFARLQGGTNQTSGANTRSTPETLASIAGWTALCLSPLFFAVTLLALYRWRKRGARRVRP